MAGDRDNMTEELFAEGSSIGRIAVGDWLDRCGGEGGGTPIVLPLLQRGSVWKAGQIIDLWDSLLRGFPVGCLMLETVKAGVPIRLPGRIKSTVLEQDAFGLLDGQQRTLSMLVGWPNKPPMDRRIWVDFADEPAAEHLFRYRVTTEHHPFGFQRGNPSSRLSLADRGRALIVHEARIGARHGAGLPDFRQTVPYHAGGSLPVDLADLITWFRKENSLETWRRCLIDHLRTIRNWTVRRGEHGELQAIEIDWKLMCGLLESEAVQKRMAEVYRALTRMHRLELPLVRVDDDRIYSSQDLEGEDPALAILFKRVGSNGTPLTDEDYLFSVIKHHCPETHDLVEEIRLPENEARDYNVAGLLSPTGIVTTAVRLAAAGCSGEQGKPLPDQEVLDKKQFSRLLRSQVWQKGVAEDASFLESAFLPLVKEGKLASIFSRLGELLKYRGAGDIGFPSHALWMLGRPLIQVLLYWLLRIGGANSQIDDEARGELIRFMLFWHLCVTDKSKASRLAYALLGEMENKSDGVLQSIHNHLVKERVAMRMYSPEALNACIPEAITVTSENAEKPLIGWKRFQEIPNEPDDCRAARSFYQRWWKGDGSYHHKILLWLQRDYVVTLPGSPVAGREEETPFDYDHILPHSHWSDWTGAGKETRILDFLANPDDDNHYWMTGNSIGNVRVWSSSDNRSDGDASPNKKLGEDEGILQQSAISPNQRELWERCSTLDDQKRHWTPGRTDAFQKVVERRAFALLCSFYQDAGFSKWEGKA